MNPQIKILPGNCGRRVKVCRAYLHHTSKNKLCKKHCAEQNQKHFFHDIPPNAFMNSFCIAKILFFQNCQAIKYCLNVSEANLNLRSKLFFSQGFSSLEEKAYL